ncbi:class II myosin [Tulasnella sp. 408]|nr:class II myosin [Tulasnella sp. 408]
MYSDTNGNALSSTSAIVKHLKPDDLGVPAAPPPPSVVEELEVNKYQAAYAFVGQDDGEMSLEKNDVVELIEKDASGWWFVKKGLEEGWVPFNYLKFLPSKPKPAPAQPPAVPSL